MPLPLVSFVYGYFLPESPIYVKVTKNHCKESETNQILDVSKDQFPDQEKMPVDPETEDQPLVAHDGEIQGSWRSFLGRRWVRTTSKNWGTKSKLEPDEAMPVPQLPTKAPLAVAGSLCKVSFCEGFKGF